eukprot:Hpha_TRINITY_DN16355_c0_g5::TRINITY_DN16355_c0_g5_i1::g.59299::m.59299
MAQSFHVLVACDVFGKKLNYEFRFAGPPSPAQLQDVASRVFNEVAVQRRPPSVPQEAARLSIKKLALHTGQQGRPWEDLVSSVQLADGAQTYLLQHRSQWHTEVPGRIPLPEPAPRALSPEAHPSPMHVGSPSTRTPFHRAPSAGRELVSAGVTTAREPSGIRTGALAAQAAAHTASSRDKASRVFDELDAQRQGALSETAFVKGLLHGFYVRVDEGRARRIFQRTDQDADGVVTRTDFERFASESPALLDALYFRACDKELDSSQRRDIKAAQEGVAQMERGLVTARQALGKAESENSTGRRQLTQAEEAAEQCRRREQAHRDRAADSARAATESELRLGEAVGAFNDAQEGEERCRSGIQESIHEQEIAERRLAQQQHELQRASERLEELRRELQEQQGVVLRIQQAVGDCESHTAAAARRRSDATIRAQEQERLTAEARDAVTVAEQMIANHRTEQAEHERRAQEAVEAVERSEAKRQLDERALAGLIERVRQSQRLCDESQRRLEEQRRLLRQKEEENASLRARRREASAEEEELIDQEVRLREQREQLERSELQLRHRHTDFSRAMGENQPQYATSPSARRTR